MFVLNDPFEGGTHLPDVFFIKPLFHEGASFCFVCVSGHQVDIGGRVAGSNACDSTEVYAEGLRIPPLKLYERGAPNQTLFSLLEKNVRVPVQLMGDFRAQVASLTAGEAGLADLIQRFGAATLRRYWAELMDYTERLTRLEIARLPDGVYRFRDNLDSDGIVVRPVPIVLALTIAGDGIVADYTGSAPQVRGALNSTLSMTKAATYFAVRTVLGVDVPNNGGFFRPVEVIAERGSVLDCVLPAASAARGMTMFRVVDAVLGALAQAAPGRVPAAGEGGPTLFSFGGYDKAREPFVFVEIFGGSWGGRPDRDGIEGISHPVLNQRNIPVEVIEVENPLRVRRYGFVPDTGGAGKFRGGLSLMRDFEFVGAEPAQLQMRADRRRTRPYGLAGGQAGSPSCNLMAPGTEKERELPAMVTTTIAPGETVRFMTAGGGGWGDPRERDPQAVAEDVADGKMTPAHARAQYGIVVDAAGRAAPRKGDSHPRAGADDEPGDGQGLQHIGRKRI